MKKCGSREKRTKSENFTRGHRGGGSVGDILDGHPEVDLWDAVIVERSKT